MLITITQPAVAVSRPVSAEKLPSKEKIIFPKGKSFTADFLGKTPDGKFTKIEIGDREWYIKTIHLKMNPKILITKEQLIKALPYAKKSDIDLYYDPLNQAMVEFAINTKVRIAAFLAQIAHESGSLRWRQELASGAAYEGRKDLGNIYKGDGTKFKGRGLIQATGRENYTKIGKALKLDLVNNPTLATLPVNSARIAAWYWDSRGLNLFADLNTEDGFKIITKKINGGYNGYSDRVAHWSRTKKALGV